MAFEGLLSVVIPVYRSQAYLEQTVDELTRALEGQGSFEIILVNDGSPDDVQSVIDRLHARDSRVRFIEMGSNHGQHAATLRGFSVANGDVVVTVDDDGQNPPESVLAVVDVLQSRRLDVVYGRFESVEQNAARQLVSRLNQWMFRYTMGNRTNVRVSNVRAVRGDLARRLGNWETAFPYVDSLVFRSTRRVGEALVPHRKRSAGQSTYRLGDLVRLWISHVSTLTVLPLKIATAGSFCASVLGFFIGLVQLVRALMDRQAPEGWLSLFVALTFLFSLLFAFMGIVSTYVGRMYVSQNSRGQGWVRSSGGVSGVTPERVESRRVGVAQ